MTCTATGSLFVPLAIVYGVKWISYCQLSSPKTYQYTAVLSKANVIGFVALAAVVQRFKRIVKARWTCSWKEGVPTLTVSPA